MSLRQKATSGAYWTGMSSVAAAVLQFLQLAILARILAPEDFGLMAMMLIVIGFGQAFADGGISNAIIHRQDATREQLSSLYWLNLGAGFVVYVIVFATAPLVVLLFGEPRLKELMPISALVFLILPLGQQFQILLQKELRFKELAIIETGAVVVGSTAAIAAAMAGQGVYALIIGQLFNASCRSFGLLGIGWRVWAPAWRFRRRDLEGYVSFGLFQLGERSVNSVTRMLDQLLIGTLLGAQQLGYYSLAYNLVAQPIARINPVLTRVAFPIFARVQNDSEKLKHGYMTMRMVLASVNFPLLLGVVAIAPIFVPLVLGEQWFPSIVLIQILALVAMLRSMGNPIGTLLLAVGRVDLGFYINCALFVVLLPAIYFGIRIGGTVGVSVALLLTILAFFWIGYFALVRKVLGSCLKPYLTTLVPATVTGGLMLVAVLALAQFSPDKTIQMLAAQVATGALIYIGLNWFLYRDHTKSIIRLALGGTD